MVRALPRSKWSKEKWKDFTKWAADTYRIPYGIFLTQTITSTYKGIEKKKQELAFLEKQKDIFEELSTELEIQRKEIEAVERPKRGNDYVIHLFPDEKNDYWVNRPTPKPHNLKRKKV